MINDQMFKGCSSLVACKSSQFTIVTMNELFDMLDGYLDDDNE